jgi:hypothetical protein
MAIDIGLISFNKFKENVDGVWLGQSIPEWKDVGQTVQNAWRAAAIAASQYLQLVPQTCTRDHQCCVEGPCNGWPRSIPSMDKEIL